MSKKVNTVTLFSNGIGHFRRVYSIKNTTNLSIPFKSDCIGDVAASLQVFGKVKLDSPPSFTPANSNATSLNISQSEAMKSLLTQLSGASVKITRVNPREVIDGTLLGIDSEVKDIAGATTEYYFVVVMRENSDISRIPFDFISDVQFTQESVQTEITKALKTNFQKIKPDSTLLEISLSSLGDSETEAVVQYTIPVAAWKMRYALVENNNKFTLEGAAVIDNNTDEDWTNFQISVVTGNPVSFSTDIATVVMPPRAFVNLVEGSSPARNNSDVCYDARSGMSPNNNAKFIRAASCSIGGTTAANYSNSFESDDYLSASDEVMEQAVTAGVDTKEVGDFCVFTNKEPLTILARKSAVVNMFSVPVPSANIILYWKESNHSRRPFRAVKFKNETDYSLGRGKILIYNGEVFSGECVLEASKPGEVRLLPHCVENSVRIIKTQKGVESRRSSFKISDGVAYDEYSSKAVTEYEIENKKDEPYRVVLEHLYKIQNQNAIISISGVDVKEKEKLPNVPGSRLYFEIAPKQKCTMVVTEVYVDEQIVSLNDHWIKNAIVKTKNPLMNDPHIKECIDIQTEIDEIQQEISDLVKRKQELDNQGERVRKNLAAVTTTSDVVHSWVEDLELTEKEIRNLDQQMPVLERKHKTQLTKLREKFKEIKVSWCED